MKMTVILDGERWESQENKDVTAESASDTFYKNMDEFTRMRVELKDGGYLVFGRDAVQSAILIFTD